MFPLSSPLAPSNVSELQAAGVNHTSIRVSWTVPLCPYGNISGYLLEYREGNSQQTGERNLSSEVVEYVITELPPYTNHTIRVRALGTDSRRGDVVEVLARTHSTIPAVTLEPPVLSTTPRPPSTTAVTIIIADPTQIDTGRVM